MLLLIILTVIAHEVKSWISLVDHCVAKENKSGESNNGLKLQVNRFGLIKAEWQLTCITTVLINKVDLRLNNASEDPEPVPIKGCMLEDIIGR